METLTKDQRFSVLGFQRKLYLAVEKRWIEGEGHRRSHFYLQCFARQLYIVQNWAGREVPSVLKKGLERQHLFQRKTDQGAKRQQFLFTFGLGKSCVTSQLTRCSVHTLTFGQKFFFLHLVSGFEWFWSGLIQCVFFVFDLFFGAVHSLGYT